MNRNIRRFALYSIGVACLLIVLVTGALLHYRLDAFSTVNLIPPAKAQKPPASTPSPVTPDLAPTALLKTPVELHVERPPPNYGLSPAECRAQFPGLFDQIDRSVAWRKETGRNITSADLDLSWKSSGVARALIHNQKLYILEATFDPKGHHRPRLYATLHQLNRAISSAPFPIPSIEFTFTVDDIADETHSHHAIWAYSRHMSLDNEATWVMPDFGYWSWPLELVGEYDQVRLDMRVREVEWEKKIPKALWRGAVKTNKAIRGALLDVTTGKPWADVQEVKWKSSTQVADGSSAVAMADHCKYQFLIHTEGRSYSGRGKYLLNCQSVFITHKPQWLEPHTHLYVTSGPLQNVVEVRRDFSDLEEKVLELIRDPQRAKTIANNSAAAFRDKYLSPAAETCYWRQLFLAWAHVSFEPEIWEVGKDGRPKMRGVPFETYVVRGGPSQCSWLGKLFSRC
ncbi:uncharacterized protein EI97DRAFT_106454 [Westerdykella ornata]|uniref:Glycosyl transferase CAP10 domain-containing protein n=1 Tax=Westerdykella ornata TaxID=318751 RepID=A0A6A6JTS3_WESOR|nr:uncharacterized protein EI97DRAFT_106454 [Westerdykella ornata]KAF2279972.1 hypothetical protein EI97DRAFT_106454 [Westerdykella ornata]